MTIARVSRDYRRQYADPIRASAGTALRVGRDDPEHPGWRWCTAPDGLAGWVPEALLERRPNDMALLKTDYDATELSVRAGERVAIDERQAGWLMVRNERGERGWIPASHTDIGPGAGLPTRPPARG